jgi:succinyl-CoA synthetase beta subunit
MPLPTSAGRASYAEARALLAEHVGIPFASAITVHSEAAALAAAAELGRPVVLKADVPSGTHKAAEGLVHIGLADEHTIARAYHSIEEAGFAAVVEPFVGGGLEVILGATHDPQLGAAVLVGTGGSATEAHADVGVLPVRVLHGGSARRAVLRTAIGRHLAERTPTAVDTLVDLLLRLGRAVDGTGLAVDINPVKVDGDGGLLAVDARIIGGRP